MAPLDDWRAYVEKPDRFDGHRFEALMLALDSADSLHEAFDGLPNAAFCFSGHGLPGAGRFQRHLSSSTSTARYTARLLLPRCDSVKLNPGLRHQLNECRGAQQAKAQFQLGCASPSCCLVQTGERTCPQ